MPNPSETIRATVAATVDKQMVEFAELRERDSQDVRADDEATLLDLHGLSDAQLRAKQMADPMNWITAIMEHLDECQKKSTS